MRSNGSGFTLGVWGLRMSPLQSVYKPGASLYGFAKREKRTKNSSELKMEGVWIPPHGFPFFSSHQLALLQRRFQSHRA